MLFAAATLLTGLVLTMLVGSSSILAAILFLRSIADPILGLTQSGSGMGAGGGLNMLVIMLALLHFLRNPNRALPSSALIWGPLLICLIPSTLMSPTPNEALRWYLVMVSNAFMFLLPFYCIKTEEDLLRFFKVIVFSSLIPVAVALVFPLRDFGEGDELRAAGTFTHPNIFGFYLLVILFSCFYLLQKKIDRRLAHFLTAYIPFILIAAFLTKTRSAWAGVALIIFVYAVKFDRRFLALIIVGGILAALSPAAQERLADLGQGNINEDYAQLNSFAWRVLLWKSALQWSADHRILGYGVGSFSTYMPQFFPLGTDINMEAHSTYVQLIFEGGYVALGSYVLHLLALIAALFTYRTSTDKGLWMLPAACVVIYGIVSVSDNVLQYLVVNWYFYFAIGTVIALGATQKQQRPKRVILMPA